mmetsp:Transcript_9299/g.23081  ORF Transcript_9299/g.23081 Transcript_9299/m.23081 type:complete len:172 (-) Transcript_9299:171-686(-)
MPKYVTLGGGGIGRVAFITGLKRIHANLKRTQYLVLLCIAIARVAFVTCLKRIHELEHLVDENDWEGVGQCERPLVHWTFKNKRVDEVAAFPVVILNPHVFGRRRDVFDYSFPPRSNKHPQKVPKKDGGLAGKTKTFFLISLSRDRWCRELDLGLGYVAPSEDAIDYSFQV